MKKYRFKMNLFYLPALAVMMLFVVYPMIEAVRVSFTQWNGYSQYSSYIGLKNYLKMLTDKNLWTAFRNTLVYGFGSVVLQNVTGFLLAMFLNTRFRGHSVVRTVIYLPVMISNLIMGYVMYFFVQYDGGVLNEILGWFGRAPADWMADGTRGVVIITLINSLQYVGIYMVIYMAGLQNIPTVYYEAATIDGAGTWQKFRSITLPLIGPAMSSAVVLSLIGGLKLFDVVVSLSNGGPGFRTHSLSSYINNQYFEAQNAGYAAAVGIVTFFFILIVSKAVTSYFDRREVQM